MSYVYERLNTSQIVGALRQDQYAGWSYEGAKALAEYLEQLAEDLGEPIELDVVALRCDYNEYASLEEFNQNYDKPYANLDAVREDATVIEIPGTRGFIVQAF